MRPRGYNLNLSDINLSLLLQYLLLLFLDFFSLQCTAYILCKNLGNTVIAL